MKSGGSFDAVDSAEYQGNVLALLEAAEAFVKKHNNLRWKKLPNSRIDLPDYIERPIHEALVNAFVHRDYMKIGSEVHLDIFDNRIEITSPGGMVEGLPIQKRDFYHIASRRRNPYLADIFHRLQLMERSGSGIKEIMNDYKASANITEDRLPTFFSDESDFNVTFWNLNYGVEFCLTILPESQAKMYHDINWFRLTDEPTWESCLIYSRNRPPRKAGRYFIDLAVEQAAMIMDGKYI